MLIGRIRAKYPYTPAWRPIDQSLWVAQLSISPNYERPSEYVTLGYTFDDYLTKAVMIGQVYVEDVEYDEAPSYASCLALDKTWFYDIPNQLLYVNPSLALRMGAAEFRGLEVRSYSSKSVFTDENGFQYPPYLNTSITISDEADRGVYSKMSFVSNTVKFKNQINYEGVGEFDYTFVTKVPGADVNLLYISQEDVDAEETDLTPAYTGYVTKETTEKATYTLKMGDKRSQLNGKIPNTYYESADFPDMEDSIGDLIYEGYGELTSVPAVCTNDTIETGDVTYKYATDGTLLSAVYVDGDDGWEEVTPTASSATECTFTLDSADGRATSGKPLKAKVDCTLRAEKNPGDIIADMIERYLGLPYTADYFDTTQWATEKALLADVAILFTKRKTFFSFVELLQNGSTYPFIFRINAAGLFTIKVDDIERAVSGEYEAIDKIENFNDSHTAETDFTQYATDVVIYHSQDQETEDYQEVTVNTYKDETIDVYTLEQELEFKTLLTSESDAETRGENILLDYKMARPKHTIKMRGILTDIGIYDVIVYNSGIKVNGSITREYAGVVKLKISSYKYDFANNMTTLTGYDITDITSKEA